MIQPTKLRPRSIARFGRTSALCMIPLRPSCSVLDESSRKHASHLRADAGRGMLATARLWRSSDAPNRISGGRSFPHNSEGFTLVELTLATAFIAFILIFMLATMVQVMSNYNKGLAVKQINQTARTVAEEMSQLIQGTSATAINTAYIGNGRVCLGGVSYVWNVKGATTNKYTDGSSFTMLRVNDAAGALCSSGLPAVDKSSASELLSSDIWVQQINVAVSSNQQLVDITIGLSTASPNQPTGTDPILGTICDGGKDSQYCAVATFNTTVSTKEGE